MILLELLFLGLKVIFLLVWKGIKLLAPPLGILLVIGFVIGLIKFFCKSK